jgi:signal transduction histidine kinase/PAS domain-containing protein
LGVGVDLQQVQRELQSRLEAEQTLRELMLFTAQALAAADDAEAGFSIVLEQVCARLGYDLGLGWQPDDTGAVLRVVASTRTDDRAIAAYLEASQVLELARGEGLHGVAWEQCTPRFVENLGAQLAIPSFEEVIRRAGISACLLVPVRREGELLGILELTRRAPEPPAPSVLSALEAIAAQLALFLERGRAEARAQAATQAAEAERAWLYSLLTQAPFPLLITRGPDHRVELTNPGFARMLRPDALGRPLAEVHGHGYTEEVARLRQRAFDTGETQRLPEFRAPRPPGHPPVYASSVWAPLRDPSGKVTGIMSLVQDVTQQVMARQRAEELAGEVQQQRRWLEAILDLLPTPLALFDADTGQPLFLSARGRELGLEGAELPLQRAMRGEEVTGEHFRWRSPAGDLDMLLVARRVPTMFGNPPTVVVAAVDITRLQEVEAELQRQLDSRDDFLSVAAHELRTPLTPLLLHVQALLDSLVVTDNAGPGPLEEKLRNMEKQVIRIRQLVDRLLDVSRITAGRLQLEARPDVNLAEVADEVIERLSAQGPRGGSTIERRLEPVRGRWDRLRLEGVVENLLSNALKYGAGQPVRVEVEGQDGRARLRVVDQGIGIAPAAQHRIFERFERAVSPRHYGGLGVGLWIVRNVVAAMGGTVAVHSQPGEGSTFEVNLPT